MKILFRFSALLQYALKGRVLPICRLKLRIQLVELSSIELLLHYVHAVATEGRLLLSHLLVQVLIQH